MNAARKVLKLRRGQIKKGLTPEYDFVHNGTQPLHHAIGALMTKPDSKYLIDAVRDTPGNWNAIKWARMMEKPYKDRLILAATFITALVDMLEYGEEDYKRKMEEVKRRAEQTMKLKDVQDDLPYNIHDAKKVPLAVKEKKSSGLYDQVIDWGKKYGSTGISYKTVKPIQTSGRRVTDNTLEEARRMWRTRPDGSITNAPQPTEDPGRRGAAMPINDLPDGGEIMIGSGQFTMRIDSADFIHVADAPTPLVADDNTTLDQAIGEFESDTAELPPTTRAINALEDAVNRHLDEFERNAREEAEHERQEMEEHLRRVNDHIRRQEENQFPING